MYRIIITSKESYNSNETFIGIFRKMIKGEELCYQSDLYYGSPLFFSRHKYTDAVYRISNEEFATRFLPNKDLEEILNKMTIWEVDNGSNKTLVINRGDPRLDEMRLALNSWEVKRTLLNNKQADVVYQLDITYYDHTLKILFFQNGLLAIDGQTYKLVNGETLDEILKAIH